MLEERNHLRTISTLPGWSDAPLGPSDLAPPPGPGALDSAGTLDSAHTPDRAHTPDGQFLKAVLGGLDVTAVCAVWLLAVLLGARPDAAIPGAVAAAVTTLVGMRIAGLYQSRVCAVRSSETARVTVMALLGAAVFAGVERILARPTPTSPVLVALEAAAAVVVLRWCFARWLKARRTTGRSLRTVVLVGTNDDAVDLWTTLTSEPDLGYRVGAVVGAVRPEAPWDDLPATDRIGELGPLARRVGANGVILVGSALGDGGRAALAQSFEAGLHVQMWAGLPVDSRRLRLTPAFGVPMFYIEPLRSPATAPWARRTKRTLDVLGASVACVLAAPILAVAAVSIKLEDGGPVFYGAKRVGQFGVPFTAFKLRTMVPDAAERLAEVELLNERTDGPLFKATRDPRVTRVGRLLRATSIDELPQVWNVLNGTMSLVGPRPALPSEVEHFDDELRRRHQVRPGITGPWQLEARDNPSFNAYRRYDLSYVDSWSLGWDLLILCATVEVVAARALGPLLHLPRGKRSLP